MTAELIEQWAPSGVDICIAVLLLACFLVNRFWRKGRRSKEELPWWEPTRPWWDASSTDRKPLTNAGIAFFGFLAAVVVARESLSMYEPQSAANQFLETWLPGNTFYLVTAPILGIIAIIVLRDGIAFWQVSKKSERQRDGPN